MSLIKLRQPPCVVPLLCASTVTLLDQWEIPASWQQHQQPPPQTQPIHTLQPQPQQQYQQPHHAQPQPLTLGGIGGALRNMVKDQVSHAQDVAMGKITHAGAALANASVFESDVDPKECVKPLCKPSNCAMYPQLLASEKSSRRVANAFALSCDAALNIDGGQVLVTCRCRRALAAERCARRQVHLATRFSAR